MKKLLLALAGMWIAQFAYCQWSLEPERGYVKPVAEDTFKLKDFYNSKYSERIGDSAAIVIGHDTIIIEPLQSKTMLKRLPQLKNDLKLLEQKMYYPPLERKGGVQGNCLAYLRISSRGELDSIWIEQGLTYAMDSMIVNAVRQLPRFKPARNKGKRVEAICYYRIWFKLFD